MGRSRVGSRDGIEKQRREFIPNRAITERVRKRPIDACRSDCRQTRHASAEHRETPARRRIGAMGVTARPLAWIIDDNAIFILPRSRRTFPPPALPETQCWRGLWRLKTNGFSLTERLFSTNVNRFFGPITSHLNQSEGGFTNA
ncbi:MAG: hypothetical protein QM739_07080 [Propionivibrio sp.]